MLSCDVPVSLLARADEMANRALFRCNAFGGNGSSRTLVWACYP
jgi:hypothetical protein